MNRIAQEAEEEDQRASKGKEKKRTADKVEFITEKKLKKLAKVGQKVGTKKARKSIFQPEIGNVKSVWGEEEEDEEDAEDEEDEDDEEEDEDEEERIRWKQEEEEKKKETSTKQKDRQGGGVDGFPGQRVKDNSRKLEKKEKKEEVRGRMILENAQAMLDQQKDLRRQKRERRVKTHKPWQAGLPRKGSLSHRPKSFKRLRKKQIDSGPQDPEELESLTKTSSPIIHIHGMALIGFFTGSLSIFSMLRFYWASRRQWKSFT